MTSTQILSENESKFSDYCIVQIASFAKIVIGVKDNCERVETLMKTIDQYERVYQQIVSELLSIHDAKYAMTFFTINYFSCLLFLTKELNYMINGEVPDFRSLLFANIKGTIHPNEINSFYDNNVKNSSSNSTLLNVVSTHGYYFAQKGIMEEALQCFTDLPRGNDFVSVKQIYKDFKKTIQKDDAIVDIFELKLHDWLSNLQVMKVRMAEKIGGTYKNLADRDEIIRFGVSHPMETIKKSKILDFSGQVCNLNLKEFGGEFYVVKAIRNLNSQSNGLIYYEVFDEPHGGKGKVIRLKIKQQKTTAVIKQNGTKRRLITIACSDDEEKVDEENIDKVQNILDDSTCCGEWSEDSEDL